MIQNNIKYKIIDENSDLYDQSIELRYNEFFRKFNRPKESMFDEYENKSIRIVAYINEKVIGHARLFIENYSGEISQVVVDEDYRKMGIGFEIVRRLLKICTEKNTKIVGLDARVYASDFYKILGFTTIGDIFASKKTGLPHIRMIKEF